MTSTISKVIDRAISVKINLWLKMVANKRFILD